MASEKRGIKIALESGDINDVQFDSASIGFTLSSFKLSDPEPITEYLPVPGRIKGDLDVSYALTDGRKIYKNRALTFRLELSSYTRELRQALYMSIRSNLVGSTLKFYIPDLYFFGDYVKGKMQMDVLVNDLNHLIMDFKAVVEPYVYKDAKTTATYTLTSTPTSYRFNATTNPEDFMTTNGAIHDPVVKVTNSCKIAAEDGSWSYDLSEGEYILPELYGQGVVGETIAIVVSGSGTCTIEYQEAFL